MKNFDQFLNEDSTHSIKLKQFNVNTITFPSLENEHNLIIIRNVIVNDAMEKLKIKDAKRLLQIESTSHEDVFLVNEFRKLFPSSFISDEKHVTYDMDHVNFRVYVHVNADGLYTFDLVREDKKNSTLSIMLANPEWFIENAKPIPLMTLLEDESNRNAIDACLDRYWADEWFNKRRGAAKLNKYDL